MEWLGKHYFRNTQYLAAAAELTKRTRQVCARSSGPKVRRRKRRSNRKSIIPLQFTFLLQNGHG